MKSSILPRWMNKVSVTSGGALVSPSETRVYNRTGAACALGGVYMYDMGLTSGVETSSNSEGKLLPAVTTYDWGRDDSCWSNIVAQATDFLPHAWCVVAADEVNNNEPLRAIVSGDSVKLRINGFQGYVAPVTTGTWVASTKTLTVTGAFTNLVVAPAGSTKNAEFVVTSGTGATPGTYSIASKTNNTIVLTTELAAGDLATGDIAGYVVITYKSGSGIRGKAGFGLEVTNQTHGNRRFGYLKEDTALSANQIAAGQLVTACFSGWGLGSGPRG